MSNVYQHRKKRKNLFTSDYAAAALVDYDKLTTAIDGSLRNICIKHYGELGPFESTGFRQAFLIHLMKCNLPSFYCATLIFSYNEASFLVLFLLLFGWTRRFFCCCGQSDTDGSTRRLCSAPPDLSS